MPLRSPHVPLHVSRRRADSAEADDCVFGTLKLRAGSAAILFVVLMVDDVIETNVYMCMRAPCTRIMITIG